ITRALTNAQAAGATVHNDSWNPSTGTYPDLADINNVYTAQGSQQIDTFVTATDPRMLIVTAAGNEGPKASTLGTLNCGKNALAVGSSGNGTPATGSVDGKPKGLAANTIDQDSSRGPTPAGQLKPDVVAPGEVVAARCPQSNCSGGRYRNQSNFT